MWIAFYSVTFVVALWRLIKYPISRHWILLRVGIVAACRIVSNAMRYTEYNSSDSTRKWIVVEQVSGREVGLGVELTAFGAEQIFHVLGYYLLLDLVLLLLDLVLAPNSYLMSYSFKGKKNGAVSYILGLCHLALIPAVVLGSYVSACALLCQTKLTDPLGSQVAGALRNIRSASSNLDALKRYRLAGAALFVAVGGTSILLAVYTKRARPALRLRSWILLIAITVLAVSRLRAPSHADRG